MDDDDFLIGDEEKVEFKLTIPKKGLKPSLPKVEETILPKIEKGFAPPRQIPQVNSVNREKNNTIKSEKPKTISPEIKFQNLNQFTAESEEVASKKRKIPGPAGSIDFLSENNEHWPKRTKFEELEISKVSLVGDDEGDSDDEVNDPSFNNDFLNGAWISMLVACDLPPFTCTFLFLLY